MAFYQVLLCQDELPQFSTNLLTNSQQLGYVFIISAVYKMVMTEEPILHCDEVKANCIIQMLVPYCLSLPDSLSFN